MKDTSLREPLLAEELRATRKKRRREHAPKPNIATWLLIAWLAFMAAWGSKHLYRQWAESSNQAINATISAAAAGNATVEPAEPAPDPGAAAESCPLK